MADTNQMLAWRIARSKFNKVMLLPFYDWEPHILDRVKLRNLTPHQCHWPYGTPEDKTIAFCGRPVSRGSYCAQHYRRAHR